MTPLAQAPLNRNLLVTPGIVMAQGGDGEQESDSCVSPLCKNFFQVNPLRSSEILPVHQGCEVPVVHPYSLQVVPQDSTTKTQADLILNMLLNINDECCRVIIIKLVSHADVRRSIGEVLFSIQIVSQATFNKTPVKWEDCAPPYAVDKRAFRNHTCGRNKGLPCDTDPIVRTVGERMATLGAKTKVLKSLISVGTFEQQRLILLRVLSNPSIRDLSSSIGINLNKIQLGQQLLRCARKFIWRTKNSPEDNGGQYRTSVSKRSVVKALCLGLLPTTTKDTGKGGTSIASQRGISQLKKQASSWALVLVLAIGLSFWLTRKEQILRRV